MKEIILNNRADLQYASGRIQASQVASEAYLVGYFKGVNLCAIHSKRVTIMLYDMQLA